jgi:hypothetical protein
VTIQRLDSTFWLGTHEVSWLARTRVPLFISRRRLARQQRVRPALARWALDSGGFTELSMNGRWSITPAQYAEEVERWRVEVGGLAWAAPMDWMCEASILAQTGLTVRHHQHKTVENFLLLRELIPEVVPVLQGWTLDEYLEHVGLYEEAGVDLGSFQVVGVGSVCRRNAIEQIVLILGELAALGLPLHAFGVKGAALAVVRDVVVSADSMAWSYHARRNPHKRTEKCEHPGTCANCLHFALEWRSEMLARPSEHFQTPLNLRGAA